MAKIWFDKRYNNFNYIMRKEFKEKTIKLSLDGGFTCPNRDGTRGKLGCIFCGEEGAGEFTSSRNLSIKEQIEDQKKFLSTKWKTNSYIAYFQNFTNTYDRVENLYNKYEEALSQEGIVGLSIATRPDAISEEVLDLLEYLNSKTFLWVELGLQTIHEDSAQFIRRGYGLDIYDKIVKKLIDRKIRVVVHLIYGLPGESSKHMIESVKYICNTGIWGIKLHSLYIQEGTDLYEYYKSNPFYIMSREEYIDLLCDSIELIPEDIVIHRITGDGPKNLVLEPSWSKDKLRIITGVDQELKRRNSYQGIYYKEGNYEKF